MSPFGNTFSLAGQDPVCGLVAGALESALFDKGFQQIKGMVINFDPVLRYSLHIEGEDFRGQAFDLDPG